MIGKLLAILVVVAFIMFLFTMLEVAASLRYYATHKLPKPLRLLLGVILVAVITFALLI